MLLTWGALTLAGAGLTLLIEAVAGRFTYAAAPVLLFMLNASVLAVLEPQRRHEAESREDRWLLIPAWAVAFQVLLLILGFVAGFREPLLGQAGTWGGLALVLVPSLVTSAVLALALGWRSAASWTAAGGAVLGAAVAFALATWLPAWTARPAPGGYWVNDYAAGLVAMVAWHACVSLGLGVWTWRERVRAAWALSRLRCPFCGYDLSGLDEARCPECGKRPEDLAVA